MAESLDIPLEISPLLNRIVAKGIDKLGPRANSPSIISLLENSTGLDVTAPGFPSQINDNEPETLGSEVVPKSSYDSNK